MRRRINDHAGTKDVENVVLPTRTETIVSHDGRAKEEKVDIVHSCEATVTLGGSRGLQRSPYRH